MQGHTDDHIRPLRLETIFKFGGTDGTVMRKASKQGGKFIISYDSMNLQLNQIGSDFR